MDLEEFVKQEFHDIKEALDHIREENKEGFKDVNAKLDTTCDRLTIQETNYKNHIEQEKSEREIHDKNLDKKYQLWNLISSFGLFILGIIEFKRSF